MTTKLIASAVSLLVCLAAVAHAQTQPIGPLTADPLAQNNVGPQQAKGLIVYSHGYISGMNHTQSPTQPYVKNWLSRGYDGYRFNRRYILDPAADAQKLLSAVRLARSLGYKRVILTGQSAGAWTSIIAVRLGVEADGIIPMSPVWHG